MFSQAFGVPADLMFQGRFASKSTAQLSLLNTTVSQLAKNVSQVLTMAYRDIYGEEEDSEDPAQLVLLTSPLAATEEVVALFNAGLAPCEIAMPACLHAIGATKDEIDAAVKKMCEKEEVDAGLAAEDRAFHKKEQALALKERQAQMSSAPAKQQAEAEQTKKTPQPESGGSAGASSSGGSKGASGSKK